jgi:hypothetical protein
MSDSLIARVHRRFVDETNAHCYAVVAGIKSYRLPQTERDAVKRSPLLRRTPLRTRPKLDRHWPEATA